MQYQVIARKFRPQTFEDVVGQEHVTRVIRNAIELGRIPHAFVFSGPRGVGKTSIARILAKALNCEQGLSATPCNHCAICEDITASRAVDVFEIDAASHTGVDNIRELIENSRYAPSVARYKTFIIDEVHMLSKSAFNALLKTLEEPPPHVIFILATTELGKIPVTVLSRCQRYDFRRIAVEEIKAHLKSIAEREAISISDDALTLIALQSDGGMRDAQGMLEHVAATGQDVSADTVAAMLGLVGRTTLRELASALVRQDATTMLDTVGRVYQYGQDLGQLYRELLETYRNLMVIAAGYTKLALPGDEMDFLQTLAAETSFDELHRALGVLIRSEEDFRYSSLPRITLEAILMRLIAAPRLNDLGALIAGAPVAAATPTRTAAPVQRAAAASPASGSNLPKTWEGFVSFLKQNDQALAALVGRANLEASDSGRIRLSAPGAFLTDQIAKALPDVGKHASDFFGQDCRITVTAREETSAPKPKPSELRSQVRQDPLVKEVITEFAAEIKDVRVKE